MDGVTVIGGGGGAGATTVVAELALALAPVGRRVAVIDADLGLGNLDALLGIRPAHSLSDVIAGRCTLSEALLATPAGVRAVVAGRSSDQPRALTPEERLRLIEQLDRIASEVDVLLIDAGAGVAPNTVFFASTAQRIVLVATPAPDAQRKTVAILSAMGSKVPKASVHIVVNRARAPFDGRRTFAELVRLTEPTLCAELHYLGTLPFDEQMDGGGHAACRHGSISAPAVRSAVEAVAAQLFVSAAAQHLSGGLCLFPR